jgi:hypothetical protein
LSTQIGLKSTYELLVERTGAQEAYLKAADADGDDEFGSSVALWGDTLAIGVYGEDSSGATAGQVNNGSENSGAVYVFVRTAAGWTQQAYLKAAPVISADYFGASVALRENMLVVGAPGASPTAASAPHGGSVYVFTRQGTEWSLQTKLVPPGIGIQDLFGICVVVDDKRLIVGAPFESSVETLSGAIYVFDRSGDSFAEPRRIKAAPVHGSALFGWSLALENDVLVVGGPQYNSLSPADTGAGMAYVFTANSSEWTQLQELPPPVSLEKGATFGWSVAVSGSTIAVSAPRARSDNVGQGPGEVFTYERANGGAWRMQQSFRAPVPRASDWYGYAVRLSAATLLITSPGDASGSAGLLGNPQNDALLDSGALFMYGHDGNEWVNTTFIKASNPDSLDYFGTALAVHEDTFVSTSPNEASDAAGVGGDQSSNALPLAGAAYVFR